MKQIISKLRKCLCLTLSIFLLTTNIQVFAQEVQNPYRNIPILASNRIENLKYFLSEMEKHKSNMLSYGLRGHGNDMKYVATDFKYFDEWVKYYVKLKDFIREYQGSINEPNLYDFIKTYKEILQKPTQKLLAYKYTANHPKINFRKYARTEDGVMLSKLQEFYSKIDKKYHNNTAELDNIFNTKIIKEWEGFHKYLEEMIKMMESFSEEIYQQSMEIQNQIIREKITPANVLEYAYKESMFSKEKASTKLALEAMDADISAKTLVTDIMIYLKEFNIRTKDITMEHPTNLLYRANMGYSLKEKLAERAKYVEELTQLKSGSKEFIKDLNKLDEPTKRYISKKITGGAWVSVGLVVGLTLLFELIPQNSNANNVNKSLEIVDALDDIAYKIENGEATMPEMLYFYTIPENESLILNDPVHTLNFVKLTESVMAAEEILEAEKENQEQETKATTENVENSILKRYMEMQQNKKVNVGNVNVADFSF